MRANTWPCSQSTEPGSPSLSPGVNPRAPPYTQARLPRTLSMEQSSEEFLGVKVGAPEAAGEAGGAAGADNQVSPNNQVPTAKPGQRHFMGKSLKWNLPEPTETRSSLGSMPKGARSHTAEQPHHPPTHPTPGCQSRRALRKDTRMHPTPKFMWNRPRPSTQNSSQRSQPLAE